MQYPVSWNKKVTKGWLLFYPSTEKESGDSGFSIRSGSTVKLLDDYVKERIKTMRTGYEDFKLLECNTTATLSGKPAYKLVYLRRSKDHTSLVKRIEFGTMVGRVIS